MTRTLRGAIAVASTMALSLGVVATATGSSPGQARQDIRIGLLLPESKTTRYEKFDRPYIEQKIKELEQARRAMENRNSGDTKVAPPKPENEPTVPLPEPGI